MHVVMIRHSKTPGNEEHRYIGRTDQMLSENGIRLAESMAEEYAEELGDVAEVYVTSLKRTQQTARILFPKARQIVTTGLREMDFGDFEGKNADQMTDDPQYRAWVDGMCTGTCPGGEQRGAFSARVCDEFARIMREHKGSDDTVVMVLHGGTIMSIGERYVSPKRNFYDSYFKNCQGVRFDVRWNEDEIQLINERTIGKTL